jgi:HSP20 family protein
MTPQANQNQEKMQPIPLRIYQSDDRLMIAAPLPGMEPEDINITLRGRTLTINVKEPGPRQDERDLLLEEWRIGPFRREVDLPQDVDGNRANVTYGNGVLVLALPKHSGPQVAGEEIRLSIVAQARGQHVGHAGQDMHETTTVEHRQQLAEHARTAGDRTV